MLSKRLIFRICLLLSLSIPLYFIVGAMRYAQRTWEMKRIGIVTSSQVVKSERYLVEDDDGDYYVYYYTVIYEDREGEVHSARLDRTQDVYDEGDSFAVIYHPEDALDVLSYKPSQMIWYPIWNFLGTALLWFIISYFCINGFIWPVIGETYLGL